VALQLFPYPIYFKLAPWLRNPEIRRTFRRIPDFGVVQPVRRILIVFGTRSCSLMQKLTPTGAAPSTR
jgi:hypothetical protein